MNPDGKENGFTLIELTIAVAIIGILAAIGIQGYLEYMEKTRATIALFDINSISKTLQASTLDNPDELPADQAAFTAFCATSGLPVNDPWKNPYQYYRIHGLHEAGGQQGRNRPQEGAAKTPQLRLRPVQHGSRREKQSGAFRQGEPGRHPPRQRRRLHRQGVLDPVGRMNLPSLPSSFGRRMLALLLLCIATPAVLFGYLSLQRVEAKLRQDTMQRMRSNSSKIAMTVYETVSSVDDQVEFLAGILGHATVRAILSPLDLESIFKDRLLVGATRIHEGSRMEPLFGNPCPPPPYNRESLAHLAGGKACSTICAMPTDGTGSSSPTASRGYPPKRNCCPAR